MSAEHNSVQCAKILGQETSLSVTASFLKPNLVRCEKRCRVATGLAFGGMAVAEAKIPLCLYQSGITRESTSCTPQLSGG